MDVQKNIHELLIEFKKTKDGYTIPLLGDNGKLNWVSVKNPKMRDSDLFRRINNTVKMLEDTCFEPTFELVTFLDIFGSRLALHATHLELTELFLSRISVLIDMLKLKLNELPPPSQETRVLCGLGDQLVAEVLENETKDGIASEVSTKRKELLSFFQMQAFPEMRGMQSGPGGMEEQMRQMQQMMEMSGPGGMEEQMMQMVNELPPISTVPLAQVQYFEACYEVVNMFQFGKLLMNPQFMMQMMSNPEMVEEMAIWESFSNPAGTIEFLCRYFPDDWQKIVPDPEKISKLVEMMENLKKDPSFNLDQFRTNKMIVLKEKFGTQGLMNRGANPQQTLGTGGHTVTPTKTLSEMMEEALAKVKISEPGSGSQDLNEKVCSAVAHLELHGSSAEQVKRAFDEAELEYSMDNCKAVATEYGKGKPEVNVDSMTDDLFFVFLE